MQSAVGIAHSKGQILEKSLSNEIREALSFTLRRIRREEERIEHKQSTQGEVPWKIPTLRNPMDRIYPRRRSRPKSILKLRKKYYRHFVRRSTPYMSEKGEVYTGPYSTTVIQSPQLGDTGWRGEKVRRLVQYCPSLGGWVAPESACFYEYKREYLGTD